MTCWEKLHSDIKFSYTVVIVVRAHNSKYSKVFL